MIISKLKCQTSGEVVVQSKNIEYLFSFYKDQYIEAFNLDKKRFKAMRRLKNKRGGVLIEIKNKESILGLFTLSEAKSDFLELGDLIKLEKDFPRKSFATAMNKACLYALKQKKKRGIYIYPNPYAIALEKMAGFKEYSLYFQKVSLILFNFVLLLPLEIYHSKIHLYKNYFRDKALRRNMELLPTRLSKFKIDIFKKNSGQSQDTKKIRIGFLYEFVPSKSYGDPFLVLGDSNFDLKDIGFEFCDNSA